MAVNFFVFTPLLREGAGVFFLSLSLREGAGVFFFSLSLREGAGVFFFSLSARGCWGIFFSLSLRESAGVFFFFLSLREGAGIFFFSLSLRERVGVRGQSVDVNLPTSSQDGEDRVSFHPHSAFSHLLPSREKGSTLSSPLAGEDVRRTGEGYIHTLPVARQTQVPTFHIQGRSAGALRGQGVVTLMDCRVANAPRNDSKLVVKFNPTSLDKEFNSHPELDSESIHFVKNTPPTSPNQGRETCNDGKYNIQSATLLRTPVKQSNIHILEVAA